jgi:hypothetical protein
LPLFVIDSPHLVCQSLVVKAWHNISAKNIEQIMAQLISLAIAFEYWVKPTKWTLQPSGLLTPSLEDGGVRRADAWQARDEFFRLKQGDTGGLLNFFNKWGQWYEQPLPGFFGDVVPLDEVWQVRERFIRGVMESITQWLTDQAVNVSPLALFQPRQEYPYFFFKSTGCSVAMHTAITLDLLRRVKFRLCSRKDCRTPFPIQSKHRQKFCSQYCGHIESVRKQRRVAKKTTGRKDAKG